MAYRANTTNVDVKGFELAIDYRFDAWMVHAHATSRDFNGTSVRDINRWFQGEFQPFYIFDMDTAGPEFMSGVLVSQQLANQWSWSSHLRRQSGASYRLGGDVPGYTRVDVKLNKSLSVGSNALDISLTIQNALDNDIQDYQKYNFMERRIFIRADYSF